MELLQIDRIIAERTLIAEADGEQWTVRVLLGEPQPFPEGTSYFCPLQIIGIGSERVGYAAGADSIQSIQLAMRMIDAYLGAFGGSLTWVEPGQTGFET